MEFKLNAQQVITLWETMIQDEELGVADDEVVSRPISPQTNSLLRSVGITWASIKPYCCLAELHTVQKTETKKLKAFFQACTDALETNET